MSNNHPAAMTVANDQSIVQMIRAAQHRLVVLTPGLRRAVAEAIGQQWKRLGPDAVTVILDVDPEVCRMGYGDIEAIQHLEPIASSLGTMVNHHPGVRIGLIMADDETLIYAPTPLLIESSPPPPQIPTQAAQQQLKPNAIRIGIPPADVERDLGLGADGAAERVIGLDKADNAAIAAMSSDLQANPPQRFDISRSVRVFNARFEFVEVEIKGASLERKTVRLPPHMLGLEEQADLRNRVEANVHLLHEQSPISGAKLLEFRRKILARYCTLLPGYGYLVLRCNKPRLERALARLAYAVKRHREQAKIALRSTMDHTREILARALAPRWQSPETSDHATREYIAGRRIERVVRDELELLFGFPGELINGIRLNIVFKGVTYETLKDERFQELVGQRLPELSITHEEYDAAKAINPPAFLEPPTPMKGAA